MLSFQKNLFLLLFVNICSTDVGEDVVEITEAKTKPRPHPPGRNLVFGNLFGLGKCARGCQPGSVMPVASVKGPSECFLYISES